MKLFLAATAIIAIATIWEAPMVAAKTPKPPTLKGTIVVLSTIGVTADAGPVPQVDLQADRVRLRIADCVTYTSQVWLPSSEAESATGVKWVMNLDSHLSVVSVTGPLWMVNNATFAFTSGVGNPESREAGPATVVVTGLSLSNRPDSSKRLVVDMATVAPGDAYTIVVQAKRTR